MAAKHNHDPSQHDGRLAKALALTMSAAELEVQAQAAFRHTETNAEVTVSGIIDMPFVGPIYSFDQYFGDYLQALSCSTVAKVKRWVAGRYLSSVGLSNMIDTKTTPASEVWSEDL